MYIPVNPSLNSVAWSTWKLNQDQVRAGAWCPTSDPPEIPAGLQTPAVSTQLGLAVHDQVEQEVELVLDVSEVSAVVEEVSLAPEVLPVGDPGRTAAQQL